MSRNSPSAFTFLYIDCLETHLANVTFSHLVDVAVGFETFCPGLSEGQANVTPTLNKPTTRGEYAHWIRASLNSRGGS